MLYSIKVKEVSFGTVEVEADTPEQAVEQVHEEYESGNIKWYNVSYEPVGQPTAVLAETPINHKTGSIKLDLEDPNVRRLMNEVVFEEAANYEGQTVLYFIGPKELLNTTSQYPESESTEIALTLPPDFSNVFEFEAEISPTKDGCDYDWNDLSLPEEEVNRLINLAEKELKRNKSKDYEER